ncbi:PI-actitoxin-Axm2a-like [Cheilinus undulatus]|uniref:PI-actitoxin-Axm2a-like n=1 Tax=Cheilinus undulatus TaxID=241271 RepID=UPI001BD3E4D8|nr:PI-actitoxin-Axm2a-like [Cheilinus undulatus]
MKKVVILFSVLILVWTWTLQVHNMEADDSDDQKESNAAASEAHFNKSEVCVMASEKGPCKAHIERFYYNSTTKTCDIFVYGGCAGNLNNFESTEECMNNCHTEEED